MRLKLHFVWLLLLHAVCASSQQEPDSVVSRPSLFVIPHASYQQETSVAPGIAYGYYFRSRDLRRISSISGSAVYTFLNQFTFNVTPKIFFNSRNWYLYSNMNFRNYPDYYYGRGNAPTQLKVAYTSQNISLLLQPQFIFSRHFLLGPSVSVRTERVKSDSALKTLQPALAAQYGAAGWEPFTQLNVGLVAAYDSRDNQFYPLKGFFAKSLLTASGAGWGSSYSLQEVSVDVRQYIPLYEAHVLAWQVYFSGIYGDGRGIPFQLLPTPGGRDLLRGFRQGMYRDNMLITAQAEYRMPVYRRLKAAVFCAAGDVLNSNDFAAGKLKVAYGAGLRYRINDARVHLRLDVAKNNYGDKIQFYITATEAF